MLRQTKRLEKCLPALRKSVGFVYGFAKNERANIKQNELNAFRKLADQMLVYDDTALAAAMTNGTITRVECHG